MSAVLRPAAAGLWPLVRQAWDRASVYLPIILMGVMALGTYWLARNTPALGGPEALRAATHEPDSLMRHFSVKTFDPAGRLKSEVYGAQAKHFPDTDTLEIDEPRIRSFNPNGELTVATARTALSNADGSEVQLVGNAVVTREPGKDAQGRPNPRLEFRGEFLHIFANTERVKSHKPVELVRGNDHFTADSMDFDNVDEVLELNGRVHGTIQPRTGP